MRVSRSPNFLTHKYNGIRPNPPPTFSFWFLQRGHAQRFHDAGGDGVVDWVFDGQVVNIMNYQRDGMLPDYARGKMSNHAEEQKIFDLLFANNNGIDGVLRRSYQATLGMVADELIVPERLIGPISQF